MAFANSETQVFLVNTSLRWQSGNSEVELLLAHGHRDVLGSCSHAVWQLLVANFGVETPAGPDALAIALYGDECQAWQGTQLMCFHWTSETSPFAHDPAKSRFLIACVPTNMYFFSGKINVTLQTLFAAICDSMNLWQRHGVADLYCRVTAIRGDWKYFTQILSLFKTPSRNEFCFRCDCTKNLLVPFTDITATALWKSQTSSCPWYEEPSLVKLEGFNLSLMSLDVLHIWFLGVGRDVAASTILILMKLGFFAGSNVSWIYSSLYAS